MCLQIKWVDDNEKRILFLPDAKWKRLWMRTHYNSINLSLAAANFIAIWCVGDPDILWRYVTLVVVFSDYCMRHWRRQQLQWLSHSASWIHFMIINKKFHLFRFVNWLKFVCLFCFGCVVHEKAKKWLTTLPIIWRTSVIVVYFQMFSRAICEIYYRNRHPLRAKNGVESLPISNGL